MIPMYIFVAIVLLVVTNIVIELYLENQDDVDYWLQSKGCNLYSARSIFVFSRWWVYHPEIGDPSHRKKGLSSIAMLWNLFWIRLHERNGDDTISKELLMTLARRSQKQRKSWWNENE